MSITNPKKWFFLGTVATALLVIPRRSSKKADAVLSDKQNIKANGDNARTNNK